MQWPREKDRHPQAKQRGLRRNQTYWHVGLGLPAARQRLSVCCLSSPAWGTLQWQPYWLTQLLSKNWMIGCGTDFVITVLVPDSVFVGIDTHKWDFSVSNHFPIRWIFMTMSETRDVHLGLSSAGSSSSLLYLWFFLLHLPSNDL